MSEGALPKDPSMSIGALGLRKAKGNKSIKYIINALNPRHGLLLREKI